MDSRFAHVEVDLLFSALINAMVYVCSWDEVLSELLMSVSATVSEI